MRYIVEQTEYGQKFTFEFDEPEAKGSIVLEECAYGFYVSLPQVSAEPVVCIDLFYQSPEWQKDNPNDRRPLQMIIYSPAQGDDPVAHVRFFDEGARISFESDVVALGEDRLHGTVYGVKG